MQDGMFAVKSNNKMSSLYKWDRRQKHLQWVYTQIIPPCFIMTIGNTCRKHFFLTHKPRRIKQEKSSLTVKQSQNRKMIQCAYSL
jgi:ribosomal protein L24E